MGMVIASLCVLRRASPSRPLPPDGGKESTTTNVIPAGDSENVMGADAALAKMVATVRHQFADVKQLATADLAAWLADDSRPRPQLLDVREPEEYAVSHLPGAIRVSPDATADEVLARIDPGRPVVAYCSVGYRSSQLVERLQAAGLTDVVNLEGSIFAWAREGRRLERNGQPVTTVHPYDTRFGRLLRSELRAQ
jgi:rhodanese-related sulfurtransferase